MREPVKFAHNDYTVKSGPQRVRELVGDAEAEELLKHRYAYINVWRAVRGPIEEFPLAVCDAKSMERKDFVATDLKYRDRTGEVYSVAYNPTHRWFYFPQMRTDEALLLKCFDSDAQRTQFTAIRRSPIRLRRRTRPRARVSKRGRSCSSRPRKPKRESRRACVLAT